MNDWKKTYFILAKECWINRMWIICGLRVDLVTESVRTYEIQFIQHNLSKCVDLLMKSFQHADDYVFIVFIGLWIGLLITCFNEICCNWLSLQTMHYQKPTFYSNSMNRELPYLVGMLELAEWIDLLTERIFSKQFWKYVNARNIF